MAFKVLCLVTVLCGMQIVHAASLQKRDLIQDIFVQPIVQLQQQIQVAINQAQSVIQGIQNQIASVIGTVTTDLQARATTVTNQISTLVGEIASIPSCAIGQADAVATLVSQSVANTQSCSVAATNTLVSAAQDALNLGTQAIELLVDSQVKLFTLPYTELPNAAGTVLSKGLLLASSITSVLAQLSTQLPTAAVQIPICGVTETAKAIQQLENIRTNVESCIRGASTSG